MIRYALIAFAVALLSGCAGLPDVKCPADGGPGAYSCQTGKDARNADRAQTADKPSRARPDKPAPEKPEPEKPEPEKPDKPSKPDKPDCPRR